MEDPRLVCVCSAPVALKADKSSRNLNRVEIYNGSCDRCSIYYVVGVWPLIP